MFMSDTMPRRKTAVRESRHYLFGAVTKCLYSKKEEPYLYKGFCFDYEEGIREIKGEAIYGYSLEKYFAPK